MDSESALKNMKITSVVNTVLILVMSIFGLLLLIPFIIAKDTSSIIIGSALIGCTFIIILYASNQIEKKNEELETKISELNDEQHELEYLVERNTKIENMISSLISMFIAPKDINGTIHETLKRTATLCNADCCYLFLFKNNEEPFLSHEWKEYEYRDQQSVFEKTGFTLFPWTIQKIRNKQIVHISEDTKLLEIAEKEKEVILSMGLHSLIAIPVESNDEIIGFISIENTSITTECCQEYTQTFKVISELVSMALSHRSFIKDLALFRNLINRSNDFIFVIDIEENVIVDVNETACQVLGYSREEFLSMQSDNIRMLFKNSFWENSLQEIVGERYLEPDQVLTKKDGSTLPAEINVTFSSQDHHKYVLAVVRDITSRKDMESRLAKTKEVMELALEGADLGMWDWNLRTNEVMYNDRWAEMIGYDAGKIENNIETWKELIHPEDLESVNDEINEHINGETPFFESEFRMKNSQGKWQWILARGKLTEWGKNKEPFRFTGTTMDLNERKIVEEELRHSNELKDLFTDIMRHDLLNPAGNIKGYSEILFEMEEEPEKSKIINNMQRNTERLIDMIDTAAKFAKIESVEELDFIKMDIMTSLKNTIEQFQQQLVEKNMNLELRAEGSYPAMLNPIVEEIFANFISNAIKYSPENTRIIVDIVDANYDWKVTVCDFGEGIDDDVKELVFDRFKRVNKSGVKGTGLGLAIVKKIAELLGGEVGVEDNPEGKGSMFWVKVKKDHVESINYNKNRFNTETDRRNESADKKINSHPLTH